MANDLLHTVEGVAPVVQVPIGGGRPRLFDEHVVVVKMNAAALAWGDNSVSSCRSYSPAKVLVLVRARFLWPCPYLERAQGVLDGVSRGPVGPPGTP